MRRDSRGLVAQQVLPILEAHACGSQSPSEGVLEVVHPDEPEALRAGHSDRLRISFRGASPRCLPARVVDPSDRMAVAREHECAVLPAHRLDHRLRDVIEDDDTVGLVLDDAGRNHEHAPFQLRQIHFPFPSQLYDFLFARSGVHLEERHVREVPVQFAEK
ncbi:MAG TPA: hypothetical protein VFS13_00225 [Steroidobacteraceae bacterium]|nr:hypothetical protein [Steroidobacteraceae bacterium]